MNPNCEFVAEVSRDEREGYCAVDRTNTVQSCLVIAGVAR
jgi:hypothetical protein